MNNWGIPFWLENKILKRDKNCVYCRIKMVNTARSSASRKRVATWEHIINNEKIINIDNIARCCAPCNSSKEIIKMD
jgi:5-methylcytosine-specific restriction endonuclease McrA